MEDVMNYAKAVAQSIRENNNESARVGVSYTIDSDQGISCVILAEGLMPGNSGISVILAEVWYRGAIAYQVHEMYDFVHVPRTFSNVTMHAKEEDAALDYIGRTFPRIAVNRTSGATKAEATIHDCDPHAETCWC